MKYGKIIYKNRIYDSIYIDRRISVLKSKFKSLNLNKNDLVAIALPRNVDMVCSMLCLLEIGVPYLLIDPSFPISRIQYMLGNTKCKYIISLSPIPDVDIVYIDLESVTSENNDYFVGSEAAYYLFTSGSTGKPKAVVVTRTGLFNFIECIPKILNLSKEVVAAFTNQTFDIFMLETVMSLYNGYDIILSSIEENSNPKQLINLIKSKNVTTIQMTPSRMSQLIAIDKGLTFLDKVHNVLIGGEQFPRELLVKLQEKNCKIFNMYGPTETTIWSSVSDLTRKSDVDIGKPIWNTMLHIINNDAEVADGQIGEICISGEGLASGYFGNEELTNKNFVFSNILGKRVYKTGDLGFKNENGDFVCLGRIDNQIKLRGHRIELEEIDYQIQKYKGIELAATCYYKNGLNSKLLCFYTGILIDIKALKVFLSKQLPEYMIPVDFYHVDELLYTSSGKIDRRQLLNTILIDEVNKSNKKETSIISSVIEIFKIVLLSDKVYGHSSLIDLAVNSLNFIEIVVKLEDEFGIEFDDDKLIYNNFNTINDIANYITNLIGKKDD